MKLISVITIIFLFTSCINKEKKSNNDIDKQIQVAQNNYEEIIKKYKTISKINYSNFSFENHDITLLHDTIDTAYVAAILSLNDKYKANGPYVGFHKNQVVQSIGFYQNDTIKGWIELYDTLGVILEKKLRFPPPLGNEGKIIFYEEYDNKSISKCWSARFSPENNNIDTYSDSIDMTIEMCCNECISYELDIKTINFNDTISELLYFKKSDTTFTLKKLKNGNNKINLIIYGVKADKTKNVGHHTINVVKKD